MRRGTDGSKDSDERGVDRWGQGQTEQLMRQDGQTVCCVSRCPNVSPLCDAFVRPDDGGLDVDGMVSHPSQLHGFLQGADHVQSVVSFCTVNRRLSHCCSPPPGGHVTPSSVLTSTGVRQLRPAEEAQVSGPSPDSLRVPEAEPGAEVVRL